MTNPILSDPAHVSGGRRRWRAVAAIMVALGTSGCVAAVIPVAASGMIARRHLHHQDTRQAEQAAAQPAPPISPSIDGRDRPPSDNRSASTVPLSAPTRQDQPQVLPTPAPAASGDRRDHGPVPAALAAADAGRMVPGRFYEGSLPPPSAAPSESVPADTPEPSPSIPVVAAPVIASHSPGWRGFLRYVAGHVDGASRLSVLPGKGGSLSAPHWLPCGDRPAAVLVELAAVVRVDRVAQVDPEAAEALDAIQTIGLPVIYTSAAGPAATVASLGALTRAGLHPPIAADTLFAMSAQPPRAELAALRQRLAANYCVIAAVGDHASYLTGFLDVAPRATTITVEDGKDWSPGWFLVPPPGTG